MSERSHPLRELTPKLAMRLRNGVLRRCMSMHECCLCDLPIKLGEFYYDGGLYLRSHFEHLNGGHEAGCTCAEG